jgi:large subunit ribosomal protein L24
MRRPLIVEGVNMVKRHTKPNPSGPVRRHRREGSADPRFQRDAVQPGDARRDRVGFKDAGGRRKVRYFKSNGEVVDV